MHIRTGWVATIAIFVCSSVAGGQTLPATSQPADPLVANFDDGMTVELVAVAHHPIDAAGWWKPDGSPMTDPVPEGLMTVKEIGTHAGPHEKAFNFFIRYETPNHHQRVMSVRLDTEPAQEIRQKIGSDVYFSQVVLPVSDAAKSTALRVEMGKSAVQKILTAENVIETKDVPVKGARNVTVHLSRDEHNPDILNVDAPTPFVDNDFVRALTTVSAGYNKNPTYPDYRRDVPTAGTTRLSFHFIDKVENISQLEIEIYRPTIFARFTDIYLDPKIKTQPTASAETGDHLENAAKRE